MTASEFQLWGVAASVVLFGIAVMFVVKGARERRCDGCHFYDRGACKRYPPARVYTGDVSKDPEAMDVSVWPVVLVDNWCGEWRKKS